MVKHAYSKAMQRFYFHLLDDIDARDEEGGLFEGVEEAVAYARMGAKELAAEEVKRGELCLDHRIIVATEAGEIIETVTFRDVVRVVG